MISGVGAMTDDTPNPDLPRPVEDLVPAERRSVEIIDPSPTLRELIEIAQQLTENELRKVLRRAHRVQRGADREG